MALFQNENPLLGPQMYFPAGKQLARRGNLATTGVPETGGPPPSMPYGLASGGNGATNWAALLAPNRTRTTGYDTARGAQFGRPGNYDDAGWDIRDGRLYFRNGTRMTESAQGRVMRLAYDQMRRGVSESDAYQQAFQKVASEINAIGAADSTFSLLGYNPGMLEYTRQTGEDGGWVNAWDLKDPYLQHLRGWLDDGGHVPQTGIIDAATWAQNYYKTGQPGTAPGTDPPRNGVQATGNAGATSTRTDTGNGGGLGAGTGAGIGSGQYTPAQQAYMAALAQNDPDTLLALGMRKQGYDLNAPGVLNRFIKGRFANLLSARIAAAGAGGGSYLDNIQDYVNDFASGVTGQGGRFFSDLAAIGREALSGGADYINNLSDQQDAARYVQQLQGLVHAGDNAMVQQSLADVLKREMADYGLYAFDNEGSGYNIDPFLKWWANRPLAKYFNP